MTQKPLTHQEFFQIPEDDISQEDKQLIEKEVLETSGTSDGSADTRYCCALRGYLAASWFFLKPDDDLRKEVGLMAACFSDGWHWALQFERPDYLPRLRRR